jgi:hypothetical protein
MNTTTSGSVWPDVALRAPMRERRPETAGRTVGSGCSAGMGVTLTASLEKFGRDAGPKYAGSGGA